MISTGKNILEANNEKLSNGSSKRLLKGITWNHSRGLVPLVSASQRFSEFHPDVEIQWEKRSLQQFADYPIEKLTEFYDMLIIDHPWVGTAAATNCVLPLNKHLPEAFLKVLEENSVGDSHKSYHYGGSQWALAIDAATPVASYRKDIFEKQDIKIPQTWEDLLALAKKGKVAAPAIPIDLLMNFYSFCITSGNVPFQSKREMVDLQTGVIALQTMRELYSLLEKKMFEYNPIQVAEAMSQTDDYWYCPFAYCYSNYSREGYSKNVLCYGDTVTINHHKILTTLGGTGIAVSAFSQNKDLALSFLQFASSPEYLASEYILNGGQPGYGFGWANECVNSLTNDFFNNSLPVIERSYVRPRYHGYLYFQDFAGDYIQEYLMKGSVNEKIILDKLNQVYIQSLKQ